MQGTCNCRTGPMLLALILMTAGLFLLVQGIMIQFNSTDIAYVVLVWYFIAFVLFVGAKLAKFSSMGACGVHCGSHMGMTSTQTKMPAKRRKR